MVLYSEGAIKPLSSMLKTYLAAVIRYIHLNPVWARIVRAPEEYPWSSHASYLKPKAVPSMAERREVLREYGPPRSFHEFTLAGNEAALEAFYAAGRQPAGVRDREVSDVGCEEGSSLSREHPRYERGKVRPSVRQVMTVVAKGFGVRASFLRKGRRGMANEARKVAMYLVKPQCDLTLQATATQFGVTNYGVVAWACAQMQAKLAKDVRFKKCVEQVESRIMQQKT